MYFQLCIVLPVHGISGVQHICKKEYITFLNFFHPVFCYFLYTTEFEWAHQLWSHRWAEPNKDVHLASAPALVLDVWFSKYFSLFKRHLTVFCCRNSTAHFSAVVNFPHSKHGLGLNLSFYVIRSRI